MIDWLTELVAISSVSSTLPGLDEPNRPLVYYLAERLSSVGCQVEVIDVPGKPGKVNLVATLGAGPGGLVLAGHTDTVPCEPALWRGDPWRAELRDGRIYGLGTCDMKGFLALVLALLPELAGARLHAPLVVVATADEESTMAGARALAAAGAFSGRRVLIGEPTGLRPVRAHKGVMMERIRLLGQSGHSSNPSLGRNALEGMHAVIGSLLAWRDELAAGPMDSRFGVPSTTLNLGRIAGGDNPNRICGHCELDIDLRPLPGQPLAALRGELRRRVVASVEGRGLVAECAELFAGVDALDTPASSALVRAAEEATGCPAGAVDFATEAPLFSATGNEVLVMGPGDVARAHQPDEYLELEALQPMLGYLRVLVRRFCL